jgi:hypothetical protein
MYAEYQVINAGTMEHFTKMWMRVLYNCYTNIYIHLRIKNKKYFRLIIYMNNNLEK